LEFPRMVHYASPSVKSRLLYLTDLEGARSIHFPVAEFGLALLRRWMPLDVQDYKSFLPKHHSFYVYSNFYGGDMEWLVNKLQADGARLELVAREGGAVLYHVAEN